MSFCVFNIFISGDDGGGRNHVLDVRVRGRGSCDDGGGVRVHVQIQCQREIVYFLFVLLLHHSQHFQWDSVRPNSRLNFKKKIDFI